MDKKHYFVANQCILDYDLTSKIFKNAINIPYEFMQMAEYFNRKALLSGSVPLGSFNCAFSHTGSVEIDASATKSLAMDGIFISLCEIQLVKYPFSLHEEVRRAVPLSWDPSSLARYSPPALAPSRVLAAALHPLFPFLQLHQELWHPCRHLRDGRREGRHLRQAAEIVAAVNPGHQELHPGSRGSEVLG